MRQYGHADATQAPIVAALRGLGYGVVNLSLLGQGIPDLLVASPDGRRLWLIEVKDAQGKNRVNPAQQRFAAKFPAPVHVVRSVEDVLRVVGLEVEGV